MPPVVTVVTPPALSIAPPEGAAGAVHRFEHEAMNCTWEMFIAGDDGDYAQQAAWAAWDEVERLERELSRFIPSSDVFQINALQPGQSVMVGMATRECLALARDVHNETGGAFDVTIGALMSRASGRRDEIRDGRDTDERGTAQLSLFADAALGSGSMDVGEGALAALTPSPSPKLGRGVPSLRGGVRARVQQHQLSHYPALFSGADSDAVQTPEPGCVGFHLLHIDDEERTVGVRSAGVTVDLGAVGKGYALDQMALVLRDWGIADALLHSGQSTVLAMGAPPPQDEQTQNGWTVTLRDPRDQTRMVGEMLLCDRALSGSGMLLHGRHILDPRTARPATGKLATWALAHSAALSDALSTAFMVMDEAEVEEYCRGRSGVAALLLLEDAGGADGASGAHGSVARLVGSGEFEGVMEAL